MDEIKDGLNKLLKSSKANKIDRKILKGLVNGEEENAEEFYEVIKSVIGKKSI